MANEIGKVAVKLTLTGQKEAVAEAKTAGSDIGKTIADALTGNASLGNVVQEVAGSIEVGVRKAVESVSKIAIGTAATALTTLTTMAVKSYAELEQSIGGVETLYKDSASDILEYANNAFANAQISANDYLDQAVKFGAALVQGLGGDTSKAARYANMAIEDMADNANKMGTSITSIQNAYQGFAKNTYTMLDNLRLGYGGTAAEMARLVNDSKVLGDEIKVDAKTVSSVPFDKIIQAIHIIQTEIGMTGTSAQEAMTTVQGSLNMTKAAFTNFVTGLADPKADLSKLLTNLIESATTALTNLIPVIQRTLVNLVPTLRSAIEDISLGLLNVFQDILPEFVAQTLQLAQSLLDSLTYALIYADSFFDDLYGAIADNIDGLFASIAELLSIAIPRLIETLPKLFVRVLTSFSRSIAEIIEYTVIPNISKVVTEVLPDFFKKIVALAIQQLHVFRDLYIAVAEAIPQMLPYVIDGVMELFLAILDILPEILPVITQATIDLLVQVADAVSENLADIMLAIVDALMAVIETLAKPENIKKVIKAAMKLLTAIVTAIPNIVVALAEAFPVIIETLTDLLTDPDFIMDITIATLELLKAMVEAVPVIIKALGTALSKAWMKSIEKTGTNLEKAFGDVGRKAVKDFANAFSSLATKIKPYAERAIEIFNNIKNAGSQFSSAIKDAFSTASNFMMKSFDSAKGKVVNAFQSILDKADSVTDNISNWFAWTTNNIMDFFSNAWNSVKGGADWVCNAIANVFKSVANWLGNNIINPVANWFSSLWNGVKNGVNALGTTIRNVFSTIGNVIKTPINAIIDGINNVLRKINSLRVPDWVPVIGGASTNFGMIPKLAQGGFINGPTQAVIGEQGKEVVIPLERNTDNWAGLLASKLAEQFEMQGSSKNITINVTNQVSNDVDVEKMMNKMATMIRRLA